MSCASRLRSPPPGWCRPPVGAAASATVPADPQLLKTFGPTRRSATSGVLRSTVRPGQAVARPVAAQAGVRTTAAGPPNTEGRRRGVIKCPQPRGQFIEQALIVGVPCFIAELYRHVLHQSEQDSRRQTRRTVGLHGHSKQSCWAANSSWRALAPSSNTRHRGSLWSAAGTPEAATCASSCRRQRVAALRRRQAHVGAQHAPIDFCRLLVAVLYLQ